MNIKRALFPFLLAGSLLLSGCAAAKPAQTPPPIPAPTPTSTPTPTPAASPTPEASAEITGDTGNETQQPIPPEPEISGTVFRFGDKEYDLQERAPAVNALTACNVVGNHIVIEGHVGPKNGVYFIFNAETETFENELDGVNLIWHSDSIETVVYSFWEEIRTYSGELIGCVPVPEGRQPLILQLAFVDDYSAVEATYETEEGEAKEVFALPGDSSRRSE